MTCKWVTGYSENSKQNLSKLPAICELLWSRFWAHVLNFVPRLCFRLEQSRSPFRWLARRGRLPLFVRLPLRVSWGALAFIFIAAASYRSETITLSCWVSVTIEYERPPRPKAKSAEFYSIFLTLGFVCFGTSSVAQRLLTISSDRFECYSELVCYRTVSWCYVFFVSDYFIQR